MGVWIAFEAASQIFVGSTGIKHGGNLSEAAALAGILKNHDIQSPVLFLVEDDDQAQAADLGLRSGTLQAIWESDVVTGIEPVPSPPTYYLKVELSTENGSALPTTLGSSGPEPKVTPGEIIRVDASLHVADDDSSALAPTGPAAIEFPIQVMNESGGDSQAVPVSVSNGEAAFHYTVPAATGKFILDESRLGPVALSGVPIKFKLMSAYPVIFWVLDDSAITPIVE